MKDGLIKQFENNFPESQYSAVRKTFEDEKFVNKHNGQIPLLETRRLCQTGSSKDSINLLDLGCGTGNQIEYSTWLEGEWSTGLDISKRMLEKAADKLRGTWGKWRYKKAIALVHANMSDSLKNDFYALLDKPYLVDRLRPKKAEKFKAIKDRKIAEVKEIFKGKSGKYFDIITSNLSFPIYTPPEKIEGVVKFYTERLKPGGLWHMSYAFDHENVEKDSIWFSHDPEAIKRVMEDYNMKLIKDKSNCLHCEVSVEQIYRSDN